MIKILRILVIVLLLVLWVAIESIRRSPKYRMVKYMLYLVELLLGLFFLLLQKAKVCSKCNKIYFAKKDRCPGCGEPLVAVFKVNEKE